MELSDFGRKMNQEAGILQLMDDLGKALSAEPPLAMFGGGNPARIPGVTAAFKDSLASLSSHHETLASMLGNYDTPQGNGDFIKAVKDFINRHYGIGITEENIAVTPGSQNGYFILFNLLAGTTGSRQKKILFPIIPEYIGYVDQSIAPEGFASVRPEIEKIGDHEFKYRVDFNNLSVGEDIGGICISRPTNPSGNVVTDEEVARLAKIAEDKDIPLIIDNAYGLPFPNVINTDATFYWSDHTVLSLSLSKIGLPAARVGIFIGPKRLMKAITNANAIISLASPGFGQYLAKPLIESDQIMGLSQEHIRPYYKERADKFKKLLYEHLPDALPWRMHAHEGSYFFWLWLDGAKRSSSDIYAYLKERRVIVVPGDYFFPGQDPKTWQHARECIRLNFARPDDELHTGIPLLAEAVKQAYL